MELFWIENRKKKNDVILRWANDKNFADHNRGDTLTLFL